MVVEQGEIIKSRFRGRSEHSLDPKGRLNFPSRFKDVLQHYGSGELMITSWGRHLRAYPASEWQTIEDKLLTKGREEPDLVRFIRHVISGIIECSLDKQGRLLLPASLRAEIGITRDVVLNGMLEFVEIWDLQVWSAEYGETRDNFDQYSISLAKLGIF